MTLYHCLNGCNVPATRQWNKGREAKVAGLHTFLCPKCACWFTEPVGKAKPSAATWGRIKHYYEPCISCGVATVRFLKLSQFGDLDIAHFKCPCGWRANLGSDAWDDLLSEKSFRAVINAYNRAELE